MAVTKVIPGGILIEPAPFRVRMFLYRYHPVPVGRYHHVIEAGGVAREPGADTGKALVVMQVFTHPSQKNSIHQDFGLCKIVGHHLREHNEHNEQNAH